MNIIKNIIFTFLIIGMLIGANVTAEYTTDDTENTKSFPSDFVPSELIIKINSDSDPNINIEDLLTGVSSIDTLNQKYQATIMRQLHQDKRNQKTDGVELSYILKIEFSDDVDITSILNEYQKLVDIEYAEPNHIYHIQATIPTDPRFNEQWGLHQTNDCDIDAPEAWDIERGDENIIIAIHDTGVDYTHPDLMDNIWENINEIPGNGIDDDGNGYIDDIRGWDFVSVEPSEVYPGEDAAPRDNDPMDFDGHGTHCAGIASAVTNDATGVAGVCWDCTIMPIRAGYTNSEGSGVLQDYDCAAGIIYAADNGADIISMSWGGDEPSQLIIDALDYAYSKGVILVTSAGNENSDVVKYPAVYPTTISIAATDKNDEKASFSNYGDWIDIAAPGVYILSTMPIGSGIESFLTVESVDYESNSMHLCAVDDVTGDLVDVGYGRVEDVQGLDLTGKIALIERGYGSFKDKIINVYNVGAIGAVVFNNIPGDLNGDLQEQQNIPAVSISQEDGQTLRTAVASETTTAHLVVASSDYEKMSGTSMACPMAAGVIGLLLSKNPGLSQNQVKTIICETADPLNTEYDLGAGRINTYQALLYNPDTPTQAPLLSPLNILMLMGLISLVGLIGLRRRK